MEIKSLSNNASLSAPRDTPHAERKSLLLKVVEKAGLGVWQPRKCMEAPPPTHTHTSIDHRKKQTRKGEWLRLPAGMAEQV